MEPSSAVTISCRELNVYEEDASPFATAEPEFVPAPIQDGSGLAVGGTVEVLPPVMPLTAEALAAARRCWLKVIRRFTESVPGKKNCLRLIGGEAKEDTITVHCRHPMAGLSSRDSARRGMALVVGDELDTTDKSYLILFGRVGNGDTTRVVSTVIPWTEILHITFQLQQSGEPRSKPETAQGVA